MSTDGPSKDLQKVIQPLLDEIGPEIRALPLVQTNSWQDNFFLRRIYHGLMMDALDGVVWKEGEDNNQKLKDIMDYLLNNHPENVSELANWVNNLFSNAEEYIQEVPAVSEALDDPEKLEYSTEKALLAFERIAKIQLAMQALQLGPSATQKQQLEHFIQTQKQFSESELIKMRLGKAWAQALDFSFLEDNTLFFGGQALDQLEFNVENIFSLFNRPMTASQNQKVFWEGIKQSTKWSILKPSVLFQKCGRALNQMTTFPLRATKALIQDLPYVGKRMGIGIEKARKLKEKTIDPATELALAAGGMGAAWYHLPSMLMRYPSSLTLDAFLESFKSGMSWPNIVLDQISLKSAVAPLSFWTGWNYSLLQASRAKARVEEGDLVDSLKDTPLTQMDLPSIYEDLSPEESESYNETLISEEEEKTKKFISSMLSEADNRRLGDAPLIEVLLQEEEEEQDEEEQDEEEQDEEEQDEEEQDEEEQEEAEQEEAEQEEAEQEEEEQEEEEQEEAEQEEEQSEEEQDEEEQEAQLLPIATPPESVRETQTSAQIQVVSDSSLTVPRSYLPSRKTRTSALLLANIKPANDAPPQRVFREGRLKTK